MKNDQQSTPVIKTAVNMQSVKIQKNTFWGFWGFFLNKENSNELCLLQKWNKSIFQRTILTSIQNTAANINKYT